MLYVNTSCGIIKRIKLVVKRDIFMINTHVKSSIESIPKHIFYSSGGKVIAKVKPGKGPILLDNIVCNGTETTLKDCTLNWGESHCTHDQDVYIKCTDPAGNVLNNLTVCLNHENYSKFKYVQNK